MSINYDVILEHYDVRLRTQIETCNIIVKAWFHYFKFIDFLTLKQRHLVRYTVIVTWVVVDLIWFIHGQ